MNSLLRSMKTNDSVTENGMATNSTSLNANLDFFFLAGASRRMDESDMISLFEKAFNEDKLTALRILFWVRDIRGGAGERRIFKVLIKYIAKRYPEYLLNTQNFKLIPEFGTWKDILELVENVDLKDSVLSFIREGLDNPETSSLTAKWLPRKGKLAAEIRKGLGMSPKAYRKELVSKTNVIETAMAEKDYEKIEYSKIPSVAFSKYRKAFERNDAKRFESFLDAVTKGDEKVNASAIFPHTLYKQAAVTRGSGNEYVSIREQWNALPNYLEGNDERIIPVCDVSGSMNTPVGGNSSLQAIDISVSMGLYFSERLEGSFKDHFITFSENPKLQHVTGDLYSRFTQIRNASWGMNTNLERVFDSILDKAVQGNVPESEMPTKVLIFSDMEFDQATNSGSGYWNTSEFKFNENAYQMIERKFKEAGYTMPNIVFWNLNGRMGNVPAQANQKRVALLSGFSPASVKGVLKGEVLTPIEVMQTVINSERYSLVNTI